MLASIHPLGERVRRSRWAITVAAHVAGSSAAGAATGLACALAGGWLFAFVGDGRHPGAGAVGAAATVCGAAAVADGTGRRRLWGTLRRQVDDAWLNRYRGWVYGGGFGIQLGVGVATIVTTAAVHAWLLLAALQHTAARGAVVGMTFGVIRSLPLLLLARVDRADRLRRLHRALERRAEPSRVIGAVGLAAIGCAVAAGLAAS